MTKAEQFAAAHDPDPAHSRHVAQNSLALFDALGRPPDALLSARCAWGVPLFAIADLDHARTLLQAAAILHDVGYSVDPDSHHKQSRDMILASGITDFPPNDIAIIACIARYHRKTLPDPRHKVYRDLDPQSQQLVNHLAAILRIADGLDRSHAGSAQSIRVTRSRGTVSIHVRQEPPSASDIEAARKKADLFEQTFGLQVEIIPD
ncbi:MAG: HD domain-containing protein [Candidatus Hydrogenedentes bacterium]|nr:HD domain-containing protein [Candidatus Hydrogenedentota bacterium]